MFHPLVTELVAAVTQLLAQLLLIARQAGWAAGGTPGNQLSLTWLAQRLATSEVRDQN